MTPIRRSISRFFDLMQHQEMGPVLGTEQGDKCYHGEVLCVRADKRGQGIAKIIGWWFRIYEKGRLSREEIRGYINAERPKSRKNYGDGKKYRCQIL